MQSSQITQAFRLIFTAYFDHDRVKEFIDACRCEDLFIAERLFRPPFGYVMEKAYNDGVWITRNEALQIGYEIFGNDQSAAVVWTQEISYNPYFNDFEQKRRDQESEEKFQAAETVRAQEKKPDNILEKTLRLMNHEKDKRLTAMVRISFLETAKENIKDINRVKTKFLSEIPILLNLLQTSMVPYTFQELVKIMLREVEQIREYSEEFVLILAQDFLQTLEREPENYETCEPIEEESPLLAPEIQAKAIEPLAFRSPERETTGLTINFRDNNYQITVESIIGAAQDFASKFSEVETGSKFGELLYRMMIHCRNEEVLHDFHVIIKRVFDHFAKLYNPAKPKDKKNETELKNDVIYQNLNVMNGKLGNMIKALGGQKVIVRIQGPEGVSEGLLQTKCK